MISLFLFSSGKTKAIDLLCTLVNRNCTVDTIDDSVTGSFQQVDFNRHLDQVANAVEAQLLQYAQHYALQANDATGTAVLVQLLGAWEEYENVANVLTSVANQSATSDELLLFRKRLQHLVRVFEHIEHVDYPHPDTKHFDDVRQILQHLQRIIRHADTLNTGGHFEWVDSKIVTAFKFGQIICLEHVNLCSSAILDRLNPVFETDGTLLLSEKGVSIDNEPEIVHRHDGFRAFLTLDPKNGEISRAMRNRCLELSINREAYTNDNLKQLVYVQGVHEMRVINTLLDIHRGCRAVSEFNQSGVSHITKCAALVAENLRMGYSAERAVYVSALEVYVRSAQTDLLGFGLAFYRNRLRQAIVDQVRLLKDATAAPSNASRINYANVIVNSGQLNAFALVRKQAEPFATVLRNYLEKVESKRDLCDLFGEFERIEVGVDDAFTRFLLYVLYEVASPADLEQRHLYVKEILRGDSSLVEELRRLNDGLFNDLRATPITKSSATLPWNSRVLPRLLTHYGGAELPLLDQLRASALLLARVLLPNIQAQATTKLSQIDAITYSHAVQTRTVQDTLDNQLLTHLHPFLTAIHAHVTTLLTGDHLQQLTYEDYAHLIAGLLWTQRLYNVSRRNLFAQKSVDQSLVDSLTLHFRWLNKHFLLPLNSLVTTTLPTTQLSKPYSHLVAFALAHDHPLNVMRKHFCKRLTNFAPYYDQRQVNTADKMRRFHNGTLLVPKIGGAFDADTMRARLLALLDEHVHALKLRLAADAPNDFVVATGNLALDAWEATELAELQPAIEAFVEQMKQIVVAESSPVDDDLDTAEDTQFEYFEKFSADDKDLSTVALTIDQLPVREYFALKALNPIYLGNSQLHRLNANYFRAIHSIGLNELDILRTIDSDAFRACEQLWHRGVLGAISSETSVERFEQLLAALPADFYRNYASFDRGFVAKMQSFALTTVAAGRRFDGNNESALSWSGPILTGSVLTALFDRSGELRATGLGDLDAWRRSLEEYGQLVWGNVALVQEEFGFE